MLCFAFFLTTNGDCRVKEWRHAVKNGATSKWRSLQGLQQWMCTGPMNSFNTCPFCLASFTKDIVHRQNLVGVACSSRQECRHQRWGHIYQTHSSVPLVCWKFQSTSCKIKMLRHFNMHKFSLDLWKHANFSWIIVQMSKLWKTHCTSIPSILTNQILKVRS